MVTRNKMKIEQLIEELESGAEEMEICTIGNDPASVKDHICFEWEEWERFKEQISTKRK